MPDNSNLEYIKAYEKYNSIFMTRFANNILSYCETKKIKISSVLDLSSKTGTFLNVFQLSKKKAFGSDDSNDMVKYSSEKYPKISFKQSKAKEELIFKNSFDIIACNNCYINTISSITNISTLFKNINKHLSNKGLFILSLYEPKSLSSDNVSFNSSSYVDLLTEVMNDSPSKSVISSTYYNNLDSYTLKSTKSTTVFIYSVENIISELKKAGFKNSSIVNSELADNGNQDENGQYFIVATKK